MRVLYQLLTERCLLIVLFFFYFLFYLFFQFHKKFIHTYVYIILYYIILYYIILHTYIFRSLCKDFYIPFFYSVSNYFLI